MHVSPTPLAFFMILVACSCRPAPAAHSDTPTPVLADTTGYAPQGETATSTPDAASAVSEASGGLHAEEIASGSFHSCARLVDGTARCWGMNEQGQLGDGTHENRPAPVVVSGLAGIVQIAAEGSRTCAVTEAGALWCWGHLLTPLPGDEDAGPYLVPRELPGWGEVRRVALGFNAECVVTRGGAAMCRGANTRGGLGDGTTEQRALPVRVHGLDSGVVDIATGYCFGCALRDNGTVRCWGWNDLHGQVGDGSGQDQPVPVDVPGLRDVVAIDAGFTHACAVRRDGGLLCWGANNGGVLGDGTTQDRLVPTLVPGVESAVALDLAGGQSCVVLRDGTGRCWGADTPERLLWPACPQPEASRMEGPGPNGSYRIGREEPYCPVPSPLPPLPTLRQVTPTSLHACALATSGTVLCWGSNFYGAIGDGTGGDLGQDRPAPTPVRE